MKLTKMIIFSISTLTALFSINSSLKTVDASSNENISIEDKDQTITTKHDVTIYEKSNNEFISTPKTLPQNTDWFTNQYVDLSNSRYYQVSTNEWVNADDAFVYQSLINGNLRTGEGHITKIINMNDHSVENCVLQRQSTWKVDRIVYLGNYQHPTKAYRIAKNEFAKISN